MTKRYKSNLSFVLVSVVLLSLLGCEVQQAKPMGPTISSKEVDASISENKRSGIPISAVSLDISSVPARLTLGSGALKLNAEVVYADGSRDQDVKLSISDTTVIKQSGNVITPLKTGRVQLFFYAAKNTDIRKSVDIVIEIEPVNPIVKPVVADSSLDPSQNKGLPQESVLSEREVSVFKNYFLDDYKVGMKWNYQIKMSGVTFKSARDIPFSNPQTLGWGFVFEEASADIGAVEATLDYIEQNKELGTYTIEVLAVEGQSVTLKTELSTRIPDIGSRPPKIKRYTPQNIGEVYTGVLERSVPESRFFTQNKINVRKPAEHNTERESIVVNVLESRSSSLQDPLHDREFSEFWLNKEEGLIRQEIHLYGSRENGNSVQSSLVMVLSSLDNV